MSIREELPRLKPTNPDSFFNRRRFLQSAGLGTIGMIAGVPGATSRRTLAGTVQPEAKEDEVIKIPFQRPDVFPPPRNARFSPGWRLTDRVVAGSHNNFYEFLPGRGGPVYQFVDKFKVEPWTIEVTGACNKPRTFDLDDLFAIEHEERVYHFRCVERWAMNVPWSGFMLKKLLDKVEPKSSAKFVRFVTANRPDEMPGITKADYYPWPYYEGLRMDEAMHELTMLATGIYGDPLPRQHGAPARLVVPWKYGYKGAKSIVKIELTETRPGTFWNDLQPTEYGFLSNVNPNIPHPRWAQNEEYLLDDQATRLPTRIFNGYGRFVAELYPDEPTEMMDKAPKKPR